MPTIVQFLGGIVSIYYIHVRFSVFFPVKICQKNSKKLSTVCFKNNGENDCRLMGIGFLHRPKGMHPKSYERLLDEFARTEQQIDEQATMRFGEALW